MSAYMSASSMGYTVMHSSYANRRGIEKPLWMINTLSTVKKSQLPSTFWSVFITCSPLTVNFHALATKLQFKQIYEIRMTDINNSV